MLTMENTQTKAVLRGLRVAPRKVRLVIDQVRGKSVSDARRILDGSVKHAALPVLKLINSAVANAKHNDFLKEESLVISTITADGGPTLHRWMPRAMGRATPLRKRTSHINVVLTGEVDEKAKAAREKAAAAPKAEEQAADAPAEEKPKAKAKAKTTEPKKMAKTGASSAAKKATVRRASGRKK